MSTTVTLTVLAGSLIGKKRVFVEGAPYLIGRSQACDLQLTDSPEFMDVSRRHCELDVSPNGVRVRDLDSRNGTFVNRERLEPLTPAVDVGTHDPAEMAWHSLDNGDELCVGSTRFRVEVRDRPAKRSRRVRQSLTGVPRHPTSAS